MAGIGVDAVHPKGGELHRVTFREYRDGPVTHPYIKGGIIGKHLFGFGRQG